jgi:hypothetical protein
MDHSYIEEHNIVDRYLLGKLSAEERQRFEEHCENCPQCIDQLRTIDDLRTGLLIVAAEDLWQSRTKAEAGLLSRILRVGRTAQVALLVGAILLIALPTGLLILKWSNARRDLAQATQMGAELPDKYEGIGETAREPSKEMETRGRQSSEQRDRLATRHRSERGGRSYPGSGIGRATPHQPVTPVFALGATRSSSFNLSQPVTRIELSPSYKSIILLLELGLDQDIQSYRAAISTTDGRGIWRESRLKPNSNDALALRFDSTLFKPGNYSLTLEGLNAQNRYVLIARYTFSIVTQ